MIYDIIYSGQGKTSSCIHLLIQLGKSTNMQKRYIGCRQKPVLVLSLIKTIGYLCFASKIWIKGYNLDEVQNSFRKEIRK